MAWSEYEDALQKERKKLEDQISDLESRVRNVERSQQVRLLLGGGEYSFRQAGVSLLDQASVQSLVKRLREVIDEINTQQRNSRDEQLTLESFLRESQNIQGVVLDTGLGLNGSFTFSELATAVVEHDGEIDGLGTYGVNRAVERVERLWEEVSDEVDSEENVTNYEETLTRLRSLKDQLDENDPELQVAALGELAPNVIPSLLEALPKVTDQTTQQQIAALQSYEPPSLADAQRAEFETKMGIAPAPAKDLGQATTQFQGPPSEFGTRPQPALTNQPSADAQRSEFEAKMGITRPAADKPEEPAIDVEDAIALIQSLGGTVSMEVVDKDLNLGGSTTTQSGAATTVTTAESDKEEVKRILAERFGGIGFFLNPDDPDMMVGIAYDAGGRPYIVAVDDPAATGAAVDLLTAIEMTGLTSDSQILAAVQKTKWHQTTDAMMRKYDFDTANMNPLELEEYLEPVLNILSDEAIFLGIQLDPARAMELAAEIQRQGKSTDLDYIRQFLNSEGLYIAANLEASAFASMTDGVMALSRSYFTPINEDMAAKYANDLYMGLETNEGMEAFFRDQAAIRYPFMVNALNSGQTPEAYFYPYTYEVERLLGRKNIDLYEEFPDIVQGVQMSNGEYRPMTMHELRRYVRGLSEWQQSPQGLDSARSLSFAIGELFGEVA